MITEMTIEERSKLLVVHISENYKEYIQFCQIEHTNNVEIDKSNGIYFRDIKKKKQRK